MGKKYLLLAGFGLMLLSFILGLKFVDSGCGLCGGVSTKPRFKYTTAIQYLPSYSKPTPQSCAFFGCSASAVLPIFVDLYLAGFAFVVVGFLIKLE